MKIAVMQPYIFPYVGYFQLIRAVDVFVFFDDVQYKRRSYITRNSILIQDRPSTFSVPVKKGKREDLINEIKLHMEQMENWKAKFLKSLEHAYAKAPFFEPVFEVIKDVFDPDIQDIAKLTETSVKKTCEYLGIQVQFENSASLKYDREGDGQTKILSICKLLNADTYINAINGKELYRGEVFEEKAIKLLFLEPNVSKYSQFSADFTSHLSIIDMMMFLSPVEIRAHLENYQFVTH